MASRNDHRPLLVLAPKVTFVFESDEGLAYIDYAPPASLCGGQSSFGVVTYASIEDNNPHLHAATIVGRAKYNPGYRLAVQIAAAQIAAEDALLTDHQELLIWPGLLAEEIRERLLSENGGRS